MVRSTSKVARPRKRCRMDSKKHNTKKNRWVNSGPGKALVF